MKKRGTFVFVALLVISVLSFLASITIAQEKTAPGEPSQKPAKFNIERLVIGTGVENLDPVGVADSFPSSTDKLYCFVEAKNIAADTQITAVWFHGEKKVLETPLSLKAGARWRTYAHKNLYGMAGTWRVEINDAKGNPVNEVVFKGE